MDFFVKEEDVLLFIIRFGYGIIDKHLVPSEILADFNLVYEAGDWVDEWYCSDRHEVIFELKGTWRPIDRKIRFGERSRTTPKQTEVAAHAEITRSRAEHIGTRFARYLSRKLEKPDLMPDEEGVFTLQSGEAAEKAFEERKKRTSDLQE